MTAPTTESRPEAPTIPWGESDRLTLALPTDWPPDEVAWPDLDGAIDDYPIALNRALDLPEGCPRLEEQAGPGTTVAIVVDDPSRWTPVREALPVILQRLHGAGVRPEDITISAGVGRHIAVSDAAMRRRVGDAVVDAYRCFSPPVDDLSAYRDLGETPEGIPVRVFRPVATADLRILIGSVLPHLQAGFGGGYKLIFPGTSHRSTLGALHRQGLDGDAGRLLGGPAADNPMRRAIRSAAAKLGPCVSISHLLGAPGEVFVVAAGHPDPVQDRLAAEARRRFQAPESAPADLVVAGNHPWPGDPMQSFKVLLQHRARRTPAVFRLGRPGRLLLDQPQRRDRRGSVPDARPARDRGVGRSRRLGDPPRPGLGRPGRRGRREPRGVPDPLGARAGRRSDGPGLRPTTPRPARRPARADRPLRRPGPALARPRRADLGSGRPGHPAPAPDLPPGRPDLRPRTKPKVSHHSAGAL